ncbi:hypothetical protein R3I93_017365 [Phoxinus phoxinus]|uniref:Uncharacterized protein n=1 Tax=Phoxinus phoxinus TaxID=58324 RepID=A0AAN9CHR8_9TELE
MDTEENSPAKKRRYERREEGAAPCPSRVSMKSTHSMGQPIHFGSGAVISEPMKASVIMDTEENSPAKERRYERREEGAAPCPSCVSMKSTHSMGQPIHFGSGAVISEPM